MQAPADGDTGILEYLAGFFQYVRRTLVADAEARAADLPVPTPKQRRLAADQAVAFVKGARPRPPLYADIRAAIDHAEHTLAQKVQRRCELVVHATEDAFSEHG